MEKLIEQDAYCSLLWSNQCVSLFCRQKEKRSKKVKLMLHAMPTQYLLRQREERGKYLLNTSSFMLQRQINAGQPHTSRT